MAKFEKGHKGMKPKGAISKKTAILDTFAKDVVEGGMEKFIEELHKLKGSAFVNAYMAIFEYVKPKLARSEIKHEGEQKFTVTFLEENNGA